MSRAKYQFLHRWPNLAGAANSLRPVPNWLDQCRTLQGIPATVRSLLAGLAAQCYGRDEVAHSHFRPLREVCLAGDLRQVLTEALLSGILEDGNR